MKKQIAIIGGGLSGMKAAKTAVECNHEALIEVFSRSSYIAGNEAEQSCIPFGDDYNSENLVHINNLDKEIHHRIKINCNTDIIRIIPELNQIVALDLKTNQETIHEYDKLIYAAGITMPVPEVEGITLSNVFFYKIKDDALKILSMVEEGAVRKAVVYGGSIQGLQTVLSIWRMNVPVSWVDGGRILPEFDVEISELMKKYVESKGIEVIAGEEICALIGNAKGEVVEAHTPERILQTDLVIWTSHLSPEVSLAREAGLAIGPTGAVAVNEYLESSINDIYCIGDCAESYNIITQKPMFFINNMDGCRMGAIAGHNAAVDNNEREIYPGALGTIYMGVFDTVIAKTGLSTGEAVKAGFDPEQVFMPLSEQQGVVNTLSDNVIILIADKNSRRILGVQAIGCDASIISIDIIAVAIHAGITVDKLVEMDLTAKVMFKPSIYHPVIEAGRFLKSKLDGKYEGISPTGLQSLEDKTDIILLDIRTMAEVMLGTLPDAKNIPSDELRARMSELNKEKKIILISDNVDAACTAYILLKKAGYNNVLIMDGGIMAYPYKLV